MLVLTEFGNQITQREIFALERLPAQEVPNQYLLNKRISNKALSQSKDVMEETSGSGWGWCPGEGIYLFITQNRLLLFVNCSPIFFEDKSSPHRKVQGQRLVHSGSWWLPGL